MPEVLFAGQPTNTRPFWENAESLNQQRFCDANGLGWHDHISKNRAYSLDVEAHVTRDIIARLNAQSQAERRALARLADEMGEDIHTLAAFAEKYWNRENLQKLAGAVNAGSTAAVARLDGFEKAVVEYQKALLELRHLNQTGDSRPAFGAKRREGELKVRQTYKALQDRFAAELSRFSPEAQRAKNTGTALSNADRGILLAERRLNSPKTDPRIKVADQLQAKRLTLLSNFVNRLGQGMVVLDAAARVDIVQQVHQEGGNWMRESSIQMTGFGLGGAVGTTVGRATVAGGTALAAQAGLIVAGPVGWAVLGGIVLVGIAAGFATGYFMDQAGQAGAATIWDF
ncbi:hypothetical protein QQM79_20700 [Marinobacteraceae bacterium S3BR75-40.1]